MSRKSRGFRDQKKWSVFVLITYRLLTHTFTFGCLGNTSSPPVVISCVPNHPPLPQSVWCQGANLLCLLAWVGVSQGVRTVIVCMQNHDSFRLPSLENISRLELGPELFLHLLI